MSGYGNFNLNKKRNGKKIGIVGGIIAVLLIIIICYVGITADSDDTEHISAAVRENVQLKQQISELNDQIAQLNEEIANLNEELGARPTVAPTPYEMLAEPTATDMPEETISPRTGRR